MMNIESRSPSLISKQAGKNHKQTVDDHHHHHDIDHLLETLSREKSMNWTWILHGDGFWCPESLFQSQLGNNDETGNYHQVFATHLPCNSLPDSFFRSKYKIVYLSRNPLDQFVSDWHFHQQICFDNKKDVSMEHAFKKQNFGSFWDQTLGYWNASQKSPEKVLFLKYEDLKKDCHSGVKKIAQFLQIPFTEEEEKNGLVEEIVKLCSFESLSNMEVNRPGKKNANFGLSNKDYFRKGEVGDWVNYLNPRAARRVASVMKEKFGDSGLTFEF